MRIHGQYLSYKQAICTNVYNGKQSGFGKKILKDKWLKVALV